MEIGVRITDEVIGVTKPNVYVTRLLPEPFLAALRERCLVEVNPHDRPLTREELLEAVRGRDGIVSLLTDRIDGEVFDAAGLGCKIVANYGVGFNHIDIPAATKRGILVCNTPDAVTDATADMAWALLLSVARRIVEGDQFTRHQTFKGWSPMFMMGMEVSGKTVGIIGPGRIGIAFAKRAMGFNMKILYTGNSPKPDFEKETGGQFVDLKTLLKESDYVSLHVPLTEKTQHLIGEAELKLMKKTAILINTARGPVVHEKALVEALQQGEIWGAGLDVFEREPLLEPGLTELTNVVIPPHLGTSTMDTRLRMGRMVMENLYAGLDGTKPPHCLNWDEVQQGK